MRFKPSLRIWRNSLAAAWLCLGAVAHAQSPGLLFERIPLSIVTASKTDPDGIAATVQYDVELRAEDSLKLEYIHTLNTLSPETGVMIGFEAPVIVPAPGMNVYTPVDILFIAEDGTVLQIAPHVVLGEMEQPIYAKSPIKGMLFLHSGQAATRGFLPRKSVVTAKIFTPAPDIQE